MPPAQHKGFSTTQTRPLIPQFPGESLSGLLVGEGAAVAYYAQNIAVVAVRAAEDAREEDVRGHLVIQAGHRITGPRHPDVLAAQRRERVRVRSKKGIRWGGRPAVV